MTAVDESDSSLAAKCLDICQVLAGQGLAFNFSLSIGSNFSFSLDARGKGQALATQGKTKKKKTPSTLRRNARRRTEFLKKKLEDSGEPKGPTCGSAQGPRKEDAVEEAVEKIEKAFKCDQCENSFKSENGLKIHAGKSHKKVTSLSSTPERLRQQLEGSVSLSASPLLDASREEFNLNNDAVEEQENPPLSLRPLPSPPLPHKCPPFHPCSRRECKLRKERERVKEALNKTCTNCDVDLYITMCCAEEKELCEDCCNDLGVCSWGFPHANYVL